MSEVVLQIKYENTVDGYSDEIYDRFYKVFILLCLWLIDVSMRISLLLENFLSSSEPNLTTEYITQTTHMQNKLLGNYRDRSYSIW